MIARKIVVDTDLILEHLIHREGPSHLRIVMSRCFCYTTAFNAIEAFSIARTEKEIRAVDEAMSALKVLGLNSKSAKVVGGIFSRTASPRKGDLPLLIAGVCLESKLPIVTMNPKRFSGIKELQVIPLQELAGGLRNAESGSH